MKKIFLFIFILCISFIFYSFNKIDFNIYNLLHIKHSSEFARLQSTFVNKIIFLSDSKQLVKELEILNRKYPIFDSFENGINLNDDFFLSIDELKIATLGNRELLKKSPQEFFTQSATLLFDQFSPKILPLNQDFFSLASNSKLLQQKTNVKINLSDGTMYIQRGDKIFYLAFGVLKKHYSKSQLIAFNKEVRSKNIALMSGSALFSAYGEVNGNQEGSIISIVALLLSLGFLFFAFKTTKILYLMIVIVFSLCFGLAIGFLILPKIHILSLIMSISLIGIILDFALHFMCHQEGKKITKQSIYPMKNIFILGFVISASGYIVFLFSPLAFLHQIAIISTFSLLGALLITFFCIPSLFKGTIFQSSKNFDLILKKLWKSILFLRRYRFIVYSLLIAISSFGAYVAVTQSSHENIKNYASTPQFLLDDAIKIAQTTGIASPTQVLILENCDLQCERTLIEQLKLSHLIKDAKGLSQVFLSPQEQEEVIEIFKQASKDPKILSIYTQLGIENPQAFFISITQGQAQPLQTLLKNPLAQDYKSLYLNENEQMVILDSNNNLSRDRNFQAIISNIVKTYNAKIEYFNLTQEINQGFEIIKKNAIKLKIVGLVAAFILLSFIYGPKQSLKLIAIIVLSALLTLGVLGLLGLEINIFVIFGLILASAIGIDYIIFSTNSHTSTFLRFKSIMCACITSFISFFLLFFSSTYAVAIFGLSVALGILFVALLTNLEFNH